MAAEKQVEDQKRHNRRKRRHGRHKILLSDEFRNVSIREIPPFNAQAVQALGPAAVTNNITQPCTLENFEEDPSIARGHFVMCRSSSFG